MEFLEKMRIPLVFFLLARFTECIYEEQHVVISWQSILSSFFLFWRRHRMNRNECCLILWLVLRSVNSGIRIHSSPLALAFRFSYWQPRASHRGHQNVMPAPKYIYIYMYITQRVGCMGIGRMDTN